MSAEDTNTFSANDDLNNLNDDVNSEVTSLISWFKANKLSLNIHKSKIILFKHYLENVSAGILKIHINSNTTLQVTLLNFHIDEN